MLGQKTLTTMLGQIALGQKSYKSCRMITIIIFSVIVLSVLVILSIGVHNDKPSITTEVIQMAQFPLPVISMQLRNNFKISCEFLLFDFYGDTSVLCSSHITQPTLRYGQWTGKFSPNNRTFPSNQTSLELKRILFRFDVIDDVMIDGGIPAYTINIFDSENITLADMMYNGTVEDVYFKANSSLDTSIFRSNRYFLGRNYTYHVRMSRHVTNMMERSIRNDFGLPPSYNTNTYITTVIYPTTRNSSYFEGTTGFMIDPSNFVVEALTEQRNKNALSVISNVLAVGSALLTCYAFLFGVGSINPWGIVQKYLFKEVTRKNVKDQLSINSETDNEIDLLRKNVDKLDKLIKQYVINVNWLDDNDKEKKVEDKSKKTKIMSSFKRLTSSIGNTNTTHINDENNDIV